MKCAGDATADFSLIKRFSRIVLASKLQQQD
jgi:hypothetical protein